MNRLKAGYAYARNPMNHAQISKVLLSPDLIDCIVFWTKDPAGMLNILPQLDVMGYRYYFQFTLTPYERELERNLRDKQEIIKTFVQLSEMIGKDKVLWRYDPIILNDSLTTEYHKEMFDSMCRKLQGYTEICTISFLDMYSKLNNALKGNYIREIKEPEMLILASVFSEIGRKYNIELRACSEKIDLSEYGIHSASCIDKCTIEKVCGYSIASKPDSNQRPGCGCIQSIDIGAYNTCKNGCIYCYANHSDTSIYENCAKHNPDSEILIGNIGAEEKVTLREMRSLKIIGVMDKYDIKTGIS